MGRHSSIGLSIARCSFYISLTLAALSAVSCSDDDDPYGDAPCRFDPAGCDGDLGGTCATTSNCVRGFCCLENENCGGGMCTLSCIGDLDCPSNMACQHEMCFFRCRSNADCARGQSCEHGGTICEWP